MAYLVDTYSKEVAKEFTLQRLRLTPNTLGKNRKDVPSVVRSIGGLQYGGHLIELFNRFENFRTEWFDYWCENFALIEGHVLRRALRIVNSGDYPHYFWATRSVARKRTYQNCPFSITDNHLTALDFIEIWTFCAFGIWENFWGKACQSKKIGNKASL